MIISGVILGAVGILIGPLEVILLKFYLVQPVLKSNRVLWNINIIDLYSSGIVSAQASVLATEISRKSDLNERSIKY